MEGCSPTDQSRLRLGDKDHLRVRVRRSSKILQKGLACIHTRRKPSLFVKSALVLNIMHCLPGPWILVLLKCQWEQLTEDSLPQKGAHALFTWNGRKVRYYLIRVQVITKKYHGGLGSCSFFSFLFLEKPNGRDMKIRNGYRLGKRWFDRPDFFYAELEWSRSLEGKIWTWSTPCGDHEWLFEIQERIAFVMTRNLNWAKDSDSSSWKCPESKCQWRRRL